MSTPPSSTTSVGWDTSLSSGSSAWSSPLGDASGASASASATATADLINRTKEIKVDANDYSRFKDIGKEESDDEKASAKNANNASTSASSQSDTCRNCHKPGAKLKCSVCKKAAYCARTCQASDWQFHKRICKKPEEKKPEPPRKRPAADKPATTSSASSSSSSSVSKPASSSASTATSTKKSTSTSSKEVVLDDPDLPAASDMRGYKNGLPYFHRELSEHEQSLIGDIAPKKVEVAPEVVQPVAHEGSAWNAAGTFEERNFSKWAEQKWSEVFTSKTFVNGPHEATFKAPEKINGDASICVVRGKKRFLFDYTFKLPFEVKIGSSKYKGSYEMHDISSDGDYEITCSFSKKPQNSAEAKELHNFGTGALKKEVVRLIGEFIQDFQSQ
ncbi:hypothetical protein ATCC90586_002603 [Pythium insidiosum]|nr:hypothetical protein ATCC90586_002603 [Pythium insidiosum]